MKRVSVNRQPMVVLLALLSFGFPLLLNHAFAQTPNPEAKPPASEGGSPPAPPACKARLEAVSPTYDFGSVRANDVKAISHTFLLRNSGEETLIISKVKPSCGCTSAVASANQISPGATATVTASLNPKGKSGNQSITVRVNSNDPTNTSQVLRMSGTILASWRIIPGQLDMGAMGKTQSATKDITITSQYKKEEPHYRIKAIKTESPEIHAVTAESPAQKTGAPNKLFTEVQTIVRVSVTADSTEGGKSQPIYIATDDPKNPTHTVTIRWTVEKDLTCNPKNVVISERRGKKIPKDLVISSHTDLAFEVIAVEIQGTKGNEDIEVTLKPDPLPARKTYTITPKFVSETAKETRTGKIIFRTNNPEQPELVVPYTASFAK